MSQISGSEIARLVLGYLQSQRMDKVALDFCKSSPYLREEYSVLKRGIKIKQVNKSRPLIDILKEFIEIEDTVTAFYDNELDKHEEIPIDLLRVRSLKDKVQYACRMFNTAGSSQSHNAAARKRPHVYVQSDYDTDSTDQSPRATYVQDLPGYTRSKRRKIYDPNLMISHKPEVIVDDSEIELPKATPAKTPMRQLNADGPCSSKLLQMSAAKVAITNKKLSDSMIARPDCQEVIAQNIMNAFPNNNVSYEHLPDGLADVLLSTPALQDLLQEVCSEAYEMQSTNSSSCASKSDQECDDQPTDRQLATPVPNDASTGIRYELRSQQKPHPAMNTSTESKRKKNLKSQIEIIDDKRIDLNENALQALQTEPILVESDSEETVTTTSQTQYQQPQQLNTQTLLIGGVLYRIQTVPATVDTQLQASTSTYSINNFANNQLVTVNPASQSNDQVIDLENYGIVITTNVAQPKQGASNIDDARARIIEINDEDVAKEGTEASQNATNGAENINSENTNSEPAEIASLPQFKSIADPKVFTPKQLIKSSIPSSTRSLSTPRNKNPHVRVLDFNTPSRLRLKDIAESSLQTPLNRSIALSLPSSAPPTINSVLQFEKNPSEKMIGSSAAETSTPANENSNISADGDTPKVRKTNRRSVVRTISAHKEINVEENEKRLKRVAKTKKKICADEIECDEVPNKKEDAQPSVSKEDAMAEWNKIRNAKNNPQLFEQNLREQISKKQENELTTGRKRRKPKKKTPPTRKHAAKKVAKAPVTLDESAQSVDISMNSTLDPDALNSTLTNYEAQLLENNLKSAKKITPVKQIIAQVKSSKKKTPLNKLQIKLIHSPKNKLLKRQKSSKNLVASQEAKKVEPLAGCSTAINTDEKEKTESESHRVNDITNDLEVARDLINMKEVILQQENQKKKTQFTEIQSDSVSMSQPANEAVITKMTCDPLIGESIDPEILKQVQQPNLSMSALLETPFKDPSTMFPRTPGISTILAQLATPMMRPCESLLNDSIFKNPQFPTPSFPPTPGFSFTPFKDILSPRSDQEVVYGAVNRPTDYSSSSSYYKPDESDGIDKQIQATIQSARANSGVYSADEMEDNSKMEDTTQHTINSSSSSSSSSSDSDSESDSSSSSDSDDDVSQVSQKSPETEKKQDGNEQSTQVELAQVVIEVEQNVEPAAAVAVEESTQHIKTHLASNTDAKIAQNILLSEPQAPIRNDQAEQKALLEEKRRRIQESLRTTEMKNHEKFKVKPTKVIKSYVDTKREHLRSIPTAGSPSKRKSTEPKKIVKVHSRQIYSQVRTVEMNEDKVVAVIASIPEAISDNAIVDASDVSTTQNPQGGAPTEEESVDAIKTHINKSRDLKDDVIPIFKEPAGQKSISPVGLIDILSEVKEKKKKLEANRPKMKAEVIAALPLQRTTRSRAKNMRIRPAQTIIAKPTTAASTSATATSTEAASAKVATDSTKNNTVEIKSNTSKEKKKSIEPVKQTKTEAANQEQPSTSAEVSSETNDVFETPAKERRSRQLRDIFGDCTDIETPIKSPPRTVISAKEQPATVEAEPTQQTENANNKFEADSSNVNDEGDDDDDDDDEEDDDDDDDDDEEEEGYEMIYIDDSDKDRFISMRSNVSVSKAVKSRDEMAAHNIGTMKVVLDGVKITLEPSDEIELFTQDMESAVSRKNVQLSRDTESNNEPSSSSEAIYGKPLHTSTPSPPKSAIPKFNIKHKPSDTVSPKKAKKQSRDEFFNDIQMSIDDVLVQLHPSTDQ